jgi:2-polyprenyl-3-methyl-5-hydroxy-6-metoxy-1,4-benzoquinol methylase
MKEPQTREKQYQFLLQRRQRGMSHFGLMSSQAWQDDPRRLTFTLSRYKFVGKMLSGLDHVLEVGCADAFGSRVVKQEVKHLTVTDFDPIFIDNAIEVMDPRWPYAAKVHDMLRGPIEGDFNAAYALDVIEHIEKKKEKRFVGNIVKSLNPHGVLILGCPSLQSQAYASPPSKAGHVNCKDGAAMRSLLQHFFHNVFLFAMNDEVVHTGFLPMAQYLVAIGSTKRI